MKSIQCEFPINSFNRVLVRLPASTLEGKVLGLARALPTAASRTATADEVKYNRLGWTHIEWKVHREDILLLGKVEARKQPPKRKTQWVFPKGPEAHFLNLRWLGQRFEAKDRKLLGSNV
ncbi:hypothetical protein ACJIZ3_000064 [Penstemon smallii]|uniref:Uncharacterized protein n=1 Tax=Penstemon smallii TaxID=265156 RepID=A0ABD3RBH3_9LAMI